MIKTNIDKLVDMAVCGEIAHPSARNFPDESVGSDGGAFVPIGSSGINYSVRVGDSAFDWASGDHVEPGVGVTNGDARANTGLVTFACLGNEAVLVSSNLDGKDAKLKGTSGIVTGKRGDAGRILVSFPKRVTETAGIDRLRRSVPPRRGRRCAGRSP